MNSIPISYETDNLSVSFTLEFGKAKEGRYMHRVNYSEPYKIEKHTVENKDMYCLLAEEGPFVMQISSVNVINKCDLYRKEIQNGYIEYKYGISAVLDLNQKPEYSSPTTFTPSNDIERDGFPWVVMNGNNLKVDQNGEAIFQWSAARALDYGVKPTPEQELMGVEERHTNTGMIYITFHGVYVEETHIKEELTRGLTRSIVPNTHAARVGYGGKVQTSSKRSSAIIVPQSRYILPIRVRIVGDAADPVVKCAKDLASALRVEQLQERTSVFPDY